VDLYSPLPKPLNITLHNIYVEVYFNSSTLPVDDIVGLKLPLYEEDKTMIPIVYINHPHDAGYGVRSDWPRTLVEDRPTNVQIRIPTSYLLNLETIIRAIWEYLGNRLILLFRKGRVDVWINNFQLGFNFEKDFNVHDFMDNVLASDGPGSDPLPVLIGCDTCSTCQDQVHAQKWAIALGQQPPALTGPCATLDMSYCVANGCFDDPGCKDMMKADAAGFFCCTKGGRDTICDTYKAYLIGDTKVNSRINCPGYMRGEINLVSGFPGPTPCTPATNLFTD